MRVLALESYFGGSHRAFLEGWRHHSRHHIDLVTLPPRHFKWRMRQAAVGFAGDERVSGAPAHYAALWCSSILNLAELTALAPALTSLPKAIYFHENQLAYPSRHLDERDVHFCFTNWLSALAADEVWFNSAFNRDSLLDGLRRLLAKMPDRRDCKSLEIIRQRSQVLAPGIDPEFLSVPRQRQPGEPLRIVWAARWEHDKAPEEFFAALDLLHRCAKDFRLSVVGPSFREVPAVFAEAQRRWASRIDAWGFQADARAYAAVLKQAHVLVSSARHEFFGLSVMEAALAGCAVIAPRRLVYPELFPRGEGLYIGGSEELAQVLLRVAADPAWYARLAVEAQRTAREYVWPRRAADLDAALETLVEAGPGRSGLASAALR